jgi:hypothetical protein
LGDFNEARSVHGREFNNSILAETYRAIGRGIEAEERIYTQVADRERRTYEGGKRFRLSKPHQQFSRLD